MAERPTFGEKVPQRGRGNRDSRPADLFPGGDDLPLFSGTPIPAVEQPYAPEDHSLKQAALPGMPPIDYDRIRQTDRARKRKRPSAPLPDAAILFADSGDTQQEDPTTITGADEREQEQHPLREALTPYIDLVSLRRLAALGEDLRQAIQIQAEPPEEIAKLLATINALLRPAAGERIKSPADIAALLMVDMGHLDQEQLRVACLDTKNKLQKVHVVYQGSLNTSLIRVGEIFKEPVRLNSAALIVAHNHPSGEPEPSPEDVMVTREIVSAGELLGVEVLDHLVIGAGKWVSMRERGLGWNM
jgi:DNA repair protein RadC